LIKLTTQPVIKPMEETAMRGK